MYKVVLTHEVIPEKLPEFIEWFKNADKKRREANPEYIPPKRYVTVYGNLRQVTIEMEFEEVPASMTKSAWLEGKSSQEELSSMFTRSEFALLKEIDTES